MSDATQHSENDSLDGLFSQARQSEPYFAADDVLVPIMQRLPAAKTLPRWSAALSDLIGFVLGLAALSQIVSLDTALHFMQQLLPTGIEVSVLSIAALSAALSIICLAAWWVAERSSEQF